MSGHGTRVPPNQKPREEHLTMGHRVLDRANQRVLDNFQIGLFVCPECEYAATSGAAWDDCPLCDSPETPGLHWYVPRAVVEAIAERRS
jgi:rubrerythrin